MWPWACPTEQERFSDPELINSGRGRAWWSGCPGWSRGRPEIDSVLLLLLKDSQHLGWRKLGDFSPGGITKSPRKKKGYIFLVYLFVFGLFQIHSSQSWLWPLSFLVCKMVTVGFVIYQRGTSQGVADKVTVLEAVLGDLTSSILKRCDCYHLGRHKILFLKVRGWMHEKATGIVRSNSEGFVLLNFGCDYMFVYSGSLHKMHFIMWVAFKKKKKSMCKSPLRVDPRSVREAKGTPVFPPCALSHTPRSPDT